MHETPANRPLRCVATSFGSAGDFLPTLAIAAALRRRGHDVRFVANPSYVAQVRRAGLDFVPAGEHADVLDHIERTPVYADGSNPSLLMRDFLGPETEATHPVIRDLLRAQPTDVVVASNVSVGALWAAAAEGVPSVLVHASPAMWMSWRAPIVLGDVVPARLARPVTPLGRALIHWYVTRFLRPLARRVGAAIPDPSFLATMRSARVELGLWSPLLRPSVAGDPPNGTICGAARASTLGGPAAAIPPEVDAFLAAGAPPVVVGLGSAFSRVAGDVLRDLAAACADLDRRCLVVGHPAGLAFPSNTLSVRWAPHEQVFARAAAVVIHGGAGTTAEALRAGRPIVGMPFAYDQFTLCEYVERLGVGRRVRVKRRSRADLVATLRAVLGDGAMARRAAEVGARFATEPDGAETAADVIERRVASASSHRDFR